MCSERRWPVTVLGFSKHSARPHFPPPPPSARWGWDQGTLTLIPGAQDRGFEGLLLLWVLGRVGPWPLSASGVTSWVSHGRITPSLPSHHLLRHVSVSKLPLMGTTPLHHTNTHTHKSGPLEWPHLNPGSSAVTRLHMRSHSEVPGVHSSSWGPLG